MANVFTAQQVVPVPQWASELIQVPKEKVARLEVHSDSTEYSAFLAYISNRAVDIDCDAPTQNINGGTIDISEREFPGILSTVALGSECNTLQSYGGEILPSLSSTGSHTNSDDGEEDEYICVKKVTLDFGTGMAHLKFEGEEICFVHVAYLPPFSLNPPFICRTLHVFAKDSELLRTFANGVILWQHKRMNPVFHKPLGMFDLYVLQQEGGLFDWHHVGTKNSRSLDSIILPDGTLDSIVEDFQNFTSPETRSWYIEHGLPYRRSWLFHGPPGTGKTSTIRCISGVLELNTYFLALGEENLSNSDLRNALKNLNIPAMLVIEDIDAVFNKNRKTNNSSPLTFSGLLNALDGLVASEDGVLIVMTTNHKERLDPALTRAGRIDRIFEFGLPTKQQMSKLFLSFYPGSSQELASKFAEAVFNHSEKEAMSIATMQEHFIYTRTMSAEESFKALDSFFSEVYPVVKEQKRESDMLKLSEN